MNNVAVLGVGHGRFGRRDDASVEELAFEAYREALEDAGIPSAQVEAWSRRTYPVNGYEAIARCVDGDDRPSRITP